MLLIKHHNFRAVLEEEGEGRLQCLNIVKTALKNATDTLKNDSILFKPKTALKNSLLKKFFKKNSI